MQTCIRIEELNDENFGHRLSFINVYFSITCGDFGNLFASWESAFGV